MPTVSPQAVQPVDAVDSRRDFLADDEMNASYSDVSAGGPYAALERFEASGLIGKSLFKLQRTNEACDTSVLAASSAHRSPHARLIVVLD